MHDYTEWLWPERERLCWLVSLSVSSVCPSGPLLLLLHNVFNMQEHSVCVNWWSWLHIRITGEPAHHSLSLSFSPCKHTHRLSNHVKICRHTKTHTHTLALAIELCVISSENRPECVCAVISIWLVQNREDNGEGVQSQPITGWRVCVCVKTVDGVVSGNQSLDIPDPFQFSPSFGTSSYPQRSVHGQFQRRAISCCYTPNATTNTTAEKMIEDINISTTWTFSPGSGEFGGHVAGKTPLFETTLNNKPSHFIDWWHNKKTEILNRTSEEFPSMFVATKADILNRTMGEIQAVFAATKPGTCISRQNLILS